jgi:SNF2 family DNA or RNA helicase
MLDHLLTHEQALNFVGMGIGKTGTTLAALAQLIQSKRAKAALVVAPLRVINLTWPMEVQGFNEFKWMRVANLRTELGQRAFITGGAHIYLINYESLPKLVDLAKKRKGVPYDIEVWDEISKAKAPGGKRIQTFRRSVPRAKRRWGLTGTPAPNSLLDLFAPTRLIDDGKRLGVSFDHYKQTFFAKADYMGYKWDIRPGSEDTIHSRIADITLTLRSSEWLDIPDTVVEDMEVPLPPDLLDRYKKFERDLILPIKKDKEITAATAAALVSKLLQFTSGSIYDENKEWHDIHELKFEALRKIQKQERSPLLVAYNFQHEAARLRKAFPTMQFFADAKSGSAQTDLLRRWNAGKVPLLAAHPQSVGHGINMQGDGDPRHIQPHVLVWLTLTYSRENYEQMIARLARRGQNEVTKVYRLMCPGTVDDAVATAILEKQKTEAHLLSALMMLESYRRSGGGELVETVEEDWV